MKKKVALIALFLVCITLVACGSHTQPTIIDLLIHFEKAGIDVNTDPITPQEKEAFNRTMKRLEKLRKKYPLLAKLPRKSQDFQEMKIVALDGLRVIIYRYESTKEARGKYGLLQTEQRVSGKERYTYLQHGPFLIKIPHWRFRVIKGRIHLFPPEIEEVEPDKTTIEKIRQALETFPLH